MQFDDIKSYLTEKGYGERVKEFPVSSATVELAAAAVGCEAARIAKTLSFLLDGGAALIVAAGDVKADNKKLRVLLWHKKERVLFPPALAREVLNRPPKVGSASDTAHIAEVEKCAVILVHVT